MMNRLKCDRARHQVRQLVLLTILLSNATVVAAESYFDFASTNLQALWGNQYKLGSSTRRILTLEHANRGAYGDFFGFVDTTVADEVGVYAELSPRVKLEHFGMPRFDSKIAKNLYFAGTLELGERGLRRTLYGLGTDLKVRGFKFVKLSLMRRDDPELSGYTTQATLSWASNFRIGKVPFVFEGFADFAGGEGGSKSQHLIVPRLLVDLDALRGSSEARLFLGIEHQYWHNKFGRGGITESVTQAQFKVVL